MSDVEWHNLDSASGFDRCQSDLVDANAENFIVNFSTDHATCALNLTAQSIGGLLDAAPGQGDHFTGTRWINFWEAERNEDAIKAIAKNYGLSSRLGASLCIRQANVPETQASRTEPPTTAGTHTALNRCFPDDLEKASNSVSSTPKSGRLAPSVPGFRDVVDNLWHFCSVSCTSNYLCVGFNALFTTPRHADETKSGSNKPPGCRIWTSLLLFHDGTVVSIFEKPPSTLPREYIGIIRYNVLNVFRQLSKLHRSTSIDSVMHVSVRPYGSADEAAMSDSESAALLFYFLFDDWTTTYNLISRQNHPCRTRLNDLRQQMFVTANMDLIKSLDLVGRQLTVLRLMYHSYELIIQRILGHSYRNVQKERLVRTFDDDIPTRASLDFSAGYPSDMPLFGHGQGNEAAASLALPQSAVARFERLLDRIRLYALTEVEECLKEKESLVFMTFNLVSLKESQAVEKLSRTTILLAKATILFLPVSLMTGYFSMQIGDIQELYSLRTYWFCFLVVLVVSIIGLVVFGITAEKLSGGTTYRSLTKTIWEASRKEKKKK